MGKDYRHEKMDREDIELGRSGSFNQRKSAIKPFFEKVKKSLNHKRNDRSLIGNGG